MNINRQFQNKHIAESDEKLVILQQIEKDICYLYFQLSSYSFIMGDLCYKEIYNLPYWNFINIIESQSDEKQSFIREGCLIMILAMAWEVIDGAGSYIMDKIEDVFHCLELFEPSNERESKLFNIVISALKYAKSNEGNLDLLNEQSTWVHNEHIRNHFRNIAIDFDSNPYFSNEANLGKK